MSEQGYTVLYNYEAEAKESMLDNKSYCCKQDLSCVRSCVVKQMIIITRVAVAMGGVGVYMPVIW